MGGIAFRAPVLARAVPDRRAGDAGDAWLGQLHRRVPDPARRLQHEARRSRSSPSPGVVLASVYMLRAFIRTMHNRVGPKRRLARHLAARWRPARAARAGDPGARRLPAARRSERSEAAAKSSVKTAPGARAPAERPGLGGPADPAERSAGHAAATGAGSGAMITLAAKGPHIDWAALSPLIALIGGALVVLIVGLLPGRGIRERGVPVLTIAALGVALGMTIWQWHDADVDHLGRAAGRRPRPRARPHLHRRRAGRRPAVPGPRRARAIGPRRVPRAAALRVAGMLVLVEAAEPGDPLPRARAAVDLAVRAVRQRAAARALAGVGAEVPRHRLGRVGHPAVRPRADLRRHRVDGLRRHRRGAQGKRGVGPAAADRRRTGRRRARLQGVRRPLPSVDAGRVRGRPHPDHGLHGGGHEGGRVRHLPAPVRHRADRRLAGLGAGAGRDLAPSRSSWATSARSGSRRSSACSRGRAWARPATCSPAWSWPARSAWRRRSTTWPCTRS